MNAMSHPRRLLPEPPDATPAAVLRARGAVQRAEWDDPADTNDRARKPWQVAGWRRRDPVRDLFAARSLERDAADRLRRDVDIASGLRGAERDGVGSGGGFATPTDAMLDAVARVRAACRALTAEEVDAVSWVVVEGASLESYEVRMRLAHGTAEKRVRGAMLSLANHYQIAPRRGFAAFRS